MPKILSIFPALTLLALGAAALVSVSASTIGPCDITGKAGNPCVAAHSTTRALYSEYSGPLYRVQRNSDGKLANVTTLEAGGFADVKVQDDFCGPHGDCVIEKVWDQSPMGNHLKQRHGLVNASRHRITVGNGVPVYGMWFDPGYGYHAPNTRGVPTGNDPESMFAVMSGSRFN
eukprot:UC1_evm1s550